MIKKKLGLFVLSLILTASFWVAPTITHATDLSGTYYIVNPFSGKVLDVTGAGTVNGTNVDIYSNHSGANQKWIVTSNGDGTYKIIDSNSNNSLDVTGYGTSDGTNVETWAYSGGNNQRWKIIQNSDSTYKIIDSNSNKALDIFGGGTADGTNVDIWPDSGTFNQKWVLVSTSTYTWNSVSINGGGLVPGLIYNPAQNGLLFARTDVGGAYRWNASTTTWTPLMDFMGKSDSDNQGVLSLAADPTNANRVYAMTGMYTASWAPNGCFYYSVDQGNTWTKTTLPFKVGGNELGRNTGERLQVDPNLSSTLFMGSNANGLWKSTNYGVQDSWSQVSSFPQSSITFVLMDPTSSTSGAATKRIIVGTTNTASPLYISNDGGSTWSAISGQPTGYVPMRAAINSGNLYVALSGFSSDSPGPQSANSGVVYKYSISGNTWTNISPASGSFGFGGIAVDKSNPNNIVATTLDKYWPTSDDVYRSTDGGQTWNSVLVTYGSINTSKAPYVASHNPHWISDIEIDPYNSNNAFFTTGYGVFYTSNLQAAVSSTSKVAWSFEDTGLEETATREIVSPPSGTNFLSAMGDQSGFKHDSLLASASSTNYNPAHGSNESVDFAASVPTKVVRTHGRDTSDTAGASYSTDGGVTWTEFPTAPAGSGSEGTIAISADGSRILWTTRDTSSNHNLMGTYLSTDNGSSWTAVTGLPTGLKPVADRANSSKFYAYDAINGIAYYSTNGGASFTASSTSLPALPSWVAYEGNIKAVFGQEGHLWLTDSNNGLYRSIDSGVTFSKVTSVTEAYRIGFGKAISSNANPSIYLVGIVGGTYGIYRSDDAGNTWTRINDSTHQYGYIADITGDPKLYGRVYIAAGGRGILYGN